ncbi:hypothetical protein T265_02290 [Opisthorchis viverrini]|uniref:Band 7 domain-containing protein n=1 Tax=Opisthorchis viverrini TaxID=6198 RepID=A0A075A783_OPIVI|nr:hypothetical protein T265_02290 [Opisthorchis viverrini]KER31525.1 hypothetical protein T265_02290 [Opisthorchis viverrini]
MYTGPGAKGQVGLNNNAKYELALLHFSFPLSGDPEAMSRGIYGVGVALSPRAERALLGWIPVNSRLCVVRLSSSIKLNASRHKKRCLFVVSAYAPTDCSSDAEKDTFYRELSRLIRQAKSTDIVILAGDLNAQVGRLSSLESHLGGRFGVDARRTDNGDRLLQLCADHELFLASTNFQHKHNPAAANYKSPVDHVAISHRWRATIQDCRSFWGTPLNSDYAMVRSRLTIKFVVAGHWNNSVSSDVAVSGARWLKWLKREFTGRKVRGSNPTSASRLPLSRLGQPGGIPALVLPSGCMAAEPFCTPGLLYQSGGLAKDDISIRIGMDGACFVNPYHSYLILWWPPNQIYVAMTSTSPEVEDECFVYPAITKRYSQVTLPNQGEPVSDNQDYNSPQPKVTPRIHGRPLRSTLKARSQFGPDPSGFTAVQGNTDIPAGFTGCDKTSDSQRRNTERIKSKDFRNTDHKSNSSLQKELEQTTGTSFLSVEPSTMSKRPSIQQLRKYSVVDPNALKYFEGIKNAGLAARGLLTSASLLLPGEKNSSQKPREFGICSALLIIMSYVLIILTFPLSLFVCIKVVAEYERAVIFRLGRIVPKGARGPGLFFVAPCIDSIRKVDLRTVTFDVPPQEVLTKDSVTVAVDAVVYYRIYNPVVAITNVEDADRSTRLLAATTLRNVLGTRNLAEILSERESISTSMQAMLDDATDPWGVKVERVEVKDVRLPVQLQRAMAAEAEATREARAKVIAAEGEEKASVALKQAADVLQCSPFALQLRYLQTLSAISAEKNSTIIFPLPIDIKDVRLPVQLQRAMAAEAEATREARAKVIAAEGEEKASVALKQAADVLQCSPFALQLRYLQTLSAISAEKNSTIIFPLPIDMLVNLIRR